jgi:hypothetical protein
MLRRPLWQRRLAVAGVRTVVAIMAAVAMNGGGSSYHAGRSHPTTSSG